MGRRRKKQENGIENDKGEQNSLRGHLALTGGNEHTACRVVQSGARGASLKMGEGREGGRTEDNPVGAGERECVCGGVGGWWWW